VKRGKDVKKRRGEEEKCRGRIVRQRKRIRRRQGEKHLGFTRRGEQGKRGSRRGGRRRETGKSEGCKRVTEK